MSMFEIPGYSAMQKALEEAAKRGEDAKKKAKDTKNPQPPPQKAKGGKITKVAGKPIGRDDGIIAAQRGEHVIRKAAAQKYGDKKMAAVNRGTAKVTTKGKR